MESYPFSVLPAELRNQIWEFALVSETELPFHSWEAGLTQTCQQVRRETLGTFYEGNTFCLGERNQRHKDLARSIQKMTDHWVRQLSNIQLRAAFLMVTNAASTAAWAGTPHVKGCVGIARLLAGRGIDARTLKIRVETPEDAPDKLMLMSERRGSHASNHSRPLSEALEVLQRRAEEAWIEKMSEFRT